jgi:hypothetical protein
MLMSTTCFSPPWEAQKYPKSTCLKKTPRINPWPAYQNGSSISPSTLYFLHKREISIPIFIDPFKRQEHTHIYNMYMYIRDTINAGHVHIQDMHPKNTNIYKIYLKNISQLVHHLTTSPATPSLPSRCRHLVDAGADDGMGLHPSPGVLEEIRKDLLALAIEETSKDLQRNER